MPRRTTIRESANKQAQPPDTTGATSLASVAIVRGGGRGGKEFHLGEPVVTMKYDDDIVTIQLTFTDHTTEVKVSWAMSNRDAKLLGNRL